MTLAPDERFRVIIEVDERDIARVRPGQHGRLALAATPGETLAFRVSRILPVAVAADGRNFFEVEAVFDDEGNALRPGLRGVAKIGVGEHPCCGSPRIAWSSGSTSRSLWGPSGRVALQPLLVSRKRPASAAAQRRAGSDSSGPPGGIC